MTTLDYYNNNLQNYIQDTATVDMSPIYDHFLSCIKSGAHILDAGCGSGRDSIYFIDNGYEVTLLDPCEGLAKSAELCTGQLVYRITFQQIQWKSKFDAVWACASLLHVPRNELTDVFKRLARSLKSGGVLYASFKYGDSDRIKESRNFTDLNEEGLNQILNIASDLLLYDSWITDDVRPGRKNEQWFNILLNRY